MKFDAKRYVGNIVYWLTGNTIQEIAKVINTNQLKLDVNTFNDGLATLTEYPGERTELKINLESIRNKDPEDKSKKYVWGWDPDAQAQVWIEVGCD